MPSPEDDMHAIAATYAEPPGAPAPSIEPLRGRRLRPPLPTVAEVATPSAARPRGVTLKGVLVVAAQLGALVLVNELAYATVGALRLPVPGNLVGMLVLLALLWAGIVRLEWIQSGATLLTRHLAFFFIPITVGLMAFAHLFVERGVAIVATLALSAAIGMGLAGHAAQALAGRRDRR
jgi:holin-like protein